MKEYEIVYKYLNGCAGAAHPQTTFEEAEISSTDDYIRAKHGADFQKFVKETTDAGQIIYTFDNGTICHIYEFTEI